jgi:hypothetical protein
MTWLGFPLDFSGWGVDIAKTEEFREVLLMNLEGEYSVRLRSALLQTSVCEAGSKPR